MDLRRDMAAARLEAQQQQAAEGALAWCGGARARARHLCHLPPPRRLRAPPAGPGPAPRSGTAERLTPRPPPLAAPPAAPRRWEADCPPNMETAASADDLAARLATAAAAGQLAVVSYFSPECYACRSLAPKLRQIAAGCAAGGGVVFIKVNGAAEGGLREHAESAGVTRIPFFQLFTADAATGAPALAAEFTANMNPEKLRLLREQIAAHAPRGGGSGEGDGEGAGEAGGAVGAPRASGFTASR